MGVLYIHYEVLTRNFTGWSLSEQKRMPHRERKYWLSVIKWQNMARD
jgi:hypothetical protein